MARQKSGASVITSSPVPAGESGGLVRPRPACIDSEPRRTMLRVGRIAGCRQAADGLRGGSCRPRVPSGQARNHRCLDTFGGAGKMEKALGGHPVVGKRETIDVSRLSFRTYCKGRGAPDRYSPLIPDGRFFDRAIRAENGREGGATGRKNAAGHARGVGGRGRERRGLSRRRP
ncbi:hypothetical protein KL86PLE_90029 [uncultured Pleomorphomonas sp.]|uniref:Uncharacterized protein n=1 Tax=uncultured Pleomorphomonas sp. TaxID=442121 RepID=A0A212LMC2_9HYPH|nr:hypothetical protein KL86PLE_90029 [uncultured Pleomorphomonas sp.]